MIILFGITYENSANHQWSSHYIFNDFISAKEYLIKDGFIEKNRLFFKENKGWCDYKKAYIVPRFIFEKHE